MTNWRTHDGVIRRWNPDAIYLRGAQNNEIRVDRKSIEEIVRNPISIMPQGLERTISDDELCDLVAYLKSLDGR